jgi:catechol 2,3-dioxygenase-like lactoylglutathione lyase family enzyme
MMITHSWGALGVLCHAEAVTMTNKLVRALHHLALGARDVERVAVFYRDVFELPEMTRHFDDTGTLRSIWLRMGASVLMIERTTADGSRVEGVGSGPFLLAFSVIPDDRARVEARLEAAGASIEARTSFSSYAHDPEGNRVAISHWPETG